MSKRIISFLLAVVMMAGAWSPAFANVPESEQQVTEEIPAQTAPETTEPESSDVQDADRETTEPEAPEAQEVLPDELSKAGADANRESLNRAANVEYTIEYYLHGDANLLGADKGTAPVGTSIGTAANSEIKVDLNRFKPDGMPAGRMLYRSSSVLKSSCEENIIQVVYGLDGDVTQAEYDLEVVDYYPRVEGVHRETVRLAPGAEIDVTAQPKDGYKVVKVITSPVSLQPAGGSTDVKGVMPAQPTRISYFYQGEYDNLFTIVHKYGDEAPSEVSEYIHSGTPVTAEPQPKPGYTLVDAQKDSSSAAGSFDINNKYTGTMPNYNLTVTYTYEKDAVTPQTEYTLKITDYYAGNLQTTFPFTDERTQTLKAGDAVKVEPELLPQFKVFKVEIISPRPAPEELEINGSDVVGTMPATDVNIYYFYVREAAPGENLFTVVHNYGDDKPSHTSVSVSPGTPITAEPQPKPGYTLKQWQADPVLPAGVFDSDNKYTAEMPGFDLTITYTYEKDADPQPTEEYTITVYDKIGEFEAIKRDDDFDFKAADDVKIYILTTPNDFVFREFTVSPESFFPGFEIKEGNIVGEMPAQNLTITLLYDTHLTPDPKARVIVTSVFRTDGVETHRTAESDAYYLIGQTNLSQFATEYAGYTLDSSVGVIKRTDNVEVNATTSDIGGTIELEKDFVYFLTFTYDKTTGGGNTGGNSGGNNGGGHIWDDGDPDTTTGTKDITPPLVPLAEIPDTELPKTGGYAGAFQATADFLPVTCGLEIKHEQDEE